MKHYESISEQLMSYLVPVHFSSGRYSYHVKVLALFSLTLGSLAILILLGLILAEKEIVPRRLVTISLASLLILCIPLMRWVKSITVLAWYVITVTVVSIWYVDFNNQSLVGPSSSLWVIPFALSGLVFSRWQLKIIITIIVSLFLLNAFLLFSDRLPESIIHRDLWPRIEVFFLLTVGLVVIVCTRGMARLAHDQMDHLQAQVDEDQKNITKINELKIKAEASVKSKTMFLATMSHELRTPLNSVIGNAQLLEKEDLPKGPRTRVEDIQLAGKLLLALINDILDFSKLEQGQLTFIESHYDLKEQLKDLGRMMESRVKEGITLKFDLPKDKVMIVADKSRLAQVFMNILSNAFKFTHAGQVSIHLVLHEGGGIEFSVTDTGSGIAEQDIDKLFMQFSQVTGDSAKNVEGTGLGLAICKGIVEQMGGKINVTSTLKQGSCFSIYLPNRIQPFSELSNEPLVEPNLSLNNIPILIVDDIKMNCIVLEGMLEEFGGNNLSTVHSGEDAIEFIKKHKDTAVILMDVRMPTMCGIEATQEIRKIGYKGIIIAVTANATKEDQFECIESGMDYFLAKPIEFEGLKRLLSRALSQ